MAAVNDANRKTGLILELLLCFNVSLSIFMYPTLNMYLCRVYATFIIGLIINLTQSSIIVVKNIIFYTGGNTITFIRTTCSTGTSDQPYLGSKSVFTATILSNTS